MAKTIFANISNNKQRFWNIDILVKCCKKKVANIADGYLSIEFKSPNLEIAKEILQSISDSGLFEYGGSHDISADENGLDGGFSCRWTGSGCWAWIDEQLGEESKLSEKAKQFLLESTINGSSQESGCQHKDKVEKDSNEDSLRVYMRALPIGIDFEFLPSVIEFVGALNLEDGKSISSGGVKIELLSSTEVNSEVEEKKFKVYGSAEFTFLVQTKKKELLKHNERRIGNFNYDCTMLEVDGDTVEEILGESSDDDWDEIVENFQFEYNETIEDLISGKEDELFELN